MFTEDQDISLLEGDYKCPICSLVMPSQKDFTAHLRGHNEVKPTPDPSDPTGQAKVYHCCLCGKMLSSFSSLDRHMLVHSGERPFSCIFCGQTFTTNGNMHRHQRTHGMKTPGDEGELGMEAGIPECKARKRLLAPGQEELCSGVSNNNQSSKELFASQSVTCPACSDTFVNDISVETHILNAHSGEPLKCDQCTAMYPTFQNLKLHKYLHHLSSIPNYPTPTSLPFTPTFNMFNKEAPSPLKIPMYQENPSDNDDEAPTLTTSSPAPPKSQLEGALTRPLGPRDKDLADIPSIITMAQGFTGLPQEELSLHASKAATPDTSIAEEPSANCSLDDEESPSKKMRYDDDVPFDDDPVIKEMKLKGEFPCSLCPSVFPNLRALKGHNKEHLGKAPYRCNVGTCQYNSNDKSTLTRHMRRHTGEKPFECKVCNFGFTTKANCERHLKNKHGKSSREQVRDSIIIHETDDTETLIHRMQNSAESSMHGSEGRAAESDLAFRCKVCKFTFMSKFAAIQHGIHTHPEYAENIDDIAEPVGVPPVKIRKNARMKSPEVIEIGSSMGCSLQDRLKGMPGFYRSELEEKEDERPLDLSQAPPSEGLDLSRRCEEEEREKDKLGSGLPAQMIPPAFYMPGMLGQANPLMMLYPHLMGSMMPQLLGAQEKDLQEKLQKELVARMTGMTGGRPPYFPPMDLASLMAAQEQQRKQSELKQQQEAAETLQKLSQMQVLPSPKMEDKNGLEAQVLSEDGKKSGEHDSSFKMVMKNGVLMKKQKQRRYRTERPYSCQSCTARFTLRSNMERHIKQQHPETWGDKLKGGRGRGGAVSLLADMKEHYTDMEMMRAEEADGEKEEEEGELIIDDQTCEEEEKPQADLASITNLLNTANNHTFNQYFKTQDDTSDSQTKDDLEGEGSEEGDRKKVGDAGEKMSAYSSAPHKIACPFCARKFPWESSLKRHILTHTGQKPYKCRACPLWFTTKSNCDRHQIRKHENTNEDTFNSRNVTDRPFKCPLCPTSTFSSESSLHLHRCTKHLNMDLGNGNNGEEVSENDDDDGEDNAGIVSSYFKCHLCDEDFIHRDHVIAHIEDEHLDAFNEDRDVYESAIRISSDVKKTGTKDEKEDDEMCRRVNCIFCPCQFVSTNELRKHILLHVNNKPFACDICNKKFTIKQALMRHKKKHDSGVSSEEEGSEEDALPHYRQTKAASEKVPDILADLASRSKRSNLMDTINKLSAAKAGQDKRSTLDQLFGNPSIAQS